MNYIHPNSKSITQKNLFSGKIDRYYYLDQKIMYVRTFLPDFMAQLYRP